MPLTRASPFRSNRSKQVKYDQAVYKDLVLWGKSPEWIAKMAANAEQARKKKAKKAVEAEE
jgi:hypothetical protein